MTTSSKKKTQQPATKPRPAAKDNAGSALNRIVSILRPLSTEKRRQVMRSVAAFYGDAPAA